MIDPPPCRQVIVGDPTDPHVQAVLDRAPRRTGLVVLDGDTVSHVVDRVGLGPSVLRDVDGHLVQLSSDVPARGWIRRLAPAGWDAEVVLGSHRGAVLSARLTLLGALLRDEAITWLSPIDRLIAAENKLVQYRKALYIGIRVPATVVAMHPRELAAAVGDPLLLKPLGVGNYAGDDGGQHIVHAQRVTVDELAGVDLAAAPFLAQELLTARSHLRIVTVQGRAWAAELDASGLPVDWRSHPPAHDAFTAMHPGDPAITASAVKLADRLGVGYSSQDWLVDKHGPAFLDLNPGGQWLFLPPQVRGPVTASLAQWLAGS